MFRVVALLLAGTGLLLAAASAASGDSGAPWGERLRFVRGGLWFPGLTAAEGRTLAENGVALSGASAPGGGWVVERPWRPRERMTLTPGHGARSEPVTVTAPLRPTPWVVWVRDWPPAPWWRAARDEVTALAFSPGGDFLGVGSAQGIAAVLRVRDGSEVWRRERPGRVIKHLAFDGGGRRLFVGEQGPEGRLAAYDIARPDGGGLGRQAPLWVRDQIDDLGGAAPGETWVTQPGAYRVLTVGGDVIAAFSHSSRGPAGRRARSRLYRLEGATGRLRWAFPAAGAAQGLMTWFAADAAGSRIAVTLQAVPGATQAGAAAPSSRAVVLDGATGTVQREFPLAPLPPYRVAEFWRGVAVHPAGTGLALGAQDGRALLFRPTPGGAWVSTAAMHLVPPLALAGATIAATNGTLLATERAAIFATGPSFVPLAHGGGEPFARHPRGNTLFAHGWRGALAWLWPLRGNLQGLAVSGDERTLAVLQGHSRPQEPETFNGVSLLNLAGSGSGSDRLLYSHGLEGRAVYGGVAVSHDGRWIAVAEAPRVLPDDPRPRGKTRLLLLR